MGGVWGGDPAPRKTEDTKGTTMIEKLSEYKITSRDGAFINADCNAKIINTLVRKINELVEFCNDIGNARSFLERHEEQITILNDAVNELQTKVNKLASNINFAQPEVKENHRIRSTNKRLREALSLAKNALIRLANDAYYIDEHVYIDAILSRIDAITKGGDNE